MAKEVYRCPVFKVIEVLQKGAVRSIVQHPGAVVIVPVTEDGCLLVVRQTRLAVDQRLYEFPAGTLELGEAPQVCAERELAEEVQKGARSWRSLGEIFPAPGFCSERQFLFAASGLYDAVAQGDEDEDIEIEKWSVVQVEQAIAGGILNDAKSLAAFCRGRLLGLW